MDPPADQPPAKDPPALLRGAGLVVFLALAGVDAFAPGWDPDPWIYLAGVALIVWGPRIIPSLVRRP